MEKRGGRGKLLHVPSCSPGKLEPEWIHNAHTNRGYTTHTQIMLS